MSLDIKDVTGQPESEDEIRETISCLTKALVTGIGTIPPEFLIRIPTALRGLEELLAYRKMIADAKSRRGTEDGGMK